MLSGRNEAERHNQLLPRQSAVAGPEIFRDFGANVLRSEWEAAQPVGPLAIATHRLAGLASMHFSRFLGFVSQITSGKQ